MVPIVHVLYWKYFITKAINVGNDKVSIHTNEHNGPISLSHLIPGLKLNQVTT